MNRIFILFLAALATSVAQAQIESPQPSPSAQIMQTVGLTDVTVEYSRPAMRDRAIFGGLVPYDKLWRTGANANTTITFSDDVTVAGSRLAAGSYALYSKPGASSWDIIFYAKTDNWGTPQDWDENLVAATVQAQPMQTAEKMENFTIAINNLEMNQADLEIGWDQTKVSVPFTVPTDQKTLASINRIMSGPSASDYFSAATFYMESGKDINQAYEWIQQAVDKSPNAYWMWRQKSLIEAKMGDKDKAIASAKKSMELAQAAPNPDYVRLNRISLEEWGVKM
jgi:tetratricopeptide (TPR) repeat protein